MSSDAHDPPSSVFISYATPDRDRAFEICRHLEALGHPCWIAPRDIRSGHDYGEEIIRGIERSRSFVLILSAAANNSVYVKREVERAVSKAKPVFPVRVEDVPPSPALEFHLASLHYLDAWSGALQDHVAALARDLADAPQPRTPVSAPEITPAWLNWRYQLIAAAVALIVLASVYRQYQVTAARKALVTAGIPGGMPAVTVKSAMEGVRTLDDCRPYVGPVFSCAVREPSAVVLTSPQGGKVVIEGGSGATASLRASLQGRGTFIPWLGPGTTARVRSADGELSASEPLADIAGAAAAIPVPSTRKGAPTLVYTLRSSRDGAEWSFLFFAPFDAQVEWSKDAMGFTRVEHFGGQREGGPFWIEASGQDDDQISIRWRVGAGEWSGPVIYRFDSAAARLRSSRPLLDVASNIACYRPFPSPYEPARVRCKARTDVPLGELFTELHWGPSPAQLSDADDFDGARWNRNQLYRPWRTAHGPNAGDFLAMGEPVDDVFFSAQPRGGGAPLTARIKVAENPALVR